ncbi:MAG: glucose-1-phosphate thymidylyltransferase RfbA [Moraxellaceae bacterium]
MKRKGIILAGGTGSRLHPLTLSVSKQLMPVYDKPMIYYPLSTLMLADIRDILIITTPHDQDAFHRLLGDGSQWGLALEYAVQPQPEGIAQALLLARNFLAAGPVALVLGDNIHYGDGLGERLRAASDCAGGATVFACQVRDPERYGVIAFNAAGGVADIIEKPAQPPSRYAVTGLYFYDGEAADIAATLQPSARGELEITDLNRAYLARAALHVELLGRGYSWMDAGTHISLLEAANFIHGMQQRQGLQIACPEEIAWHQGWIDDAALAAQAARYIGNGYGAYLRDLLQGPAV